MIRSRNELKEYLSCERALYFPGGWKDLCSGFLMRSKFWRIWRHQKALRLAEYYKNRGWKAAFAWHHRRKNVLGLSLGFEIPENCFEKGLMIYHIAPIVINEDARVGEDCRISGLFCLGNTGAGTKSPVLGSRITAGWGSCVIGDVTVADGVTLGAGCVVTRPILREGARVAGVPAKELPEKKLSEKAAGRTVSVIVPVYNAQDYLERCVDSIMGQTYPNLEILLVDDGARDESPAMCDRFAAQDGRIRVLHKENGGLISAWMAGVQMATGDYLTFVDSDDWVERCMIEEMMKRAEGNPGEIICCNFLIERPDGSQKHTHELEPGVYTGKSLEQVKGILLGRERRTVSMSRCMKLFSRELIFQNLDFCNPRIRMGEDVNIVLPALCDCSRLVILKDAFYYHYLYNTASIVHAYDERMYEGIRELVGTIRDIFREKQAPGWQEQWEKESVYLYLLALKNEVRAGAKGYTDRSRRICEEQGLCALICKHGLAAQNAANRILFGIARRPTAARCVLGHLVFAMYDRFRVG